MNPLIPSDAQARRAAPRSPWSAPEVRDLPRLTDLTLATGMIIPGGGGIGGGASTVTP